MQTKFLYFVAAALALTASSITGAEAAAVEVRDVSGGRGSGYAGPADAPTGGKPETTGGLTSGGRGSGYAGPADAPTGGKPETTGGLTSGGRGSGYAGPADAPTGGKPETSGTSSAASSGSTSGGRGSGYAGPADAPTGGKPETTGGLTSGGRGSGYAGPADAPTGGKPETSGTSSAASSGSTSGGRGSGYAGPPNAPTGGKPENAVAPKGSPQDYSNGGVNWTYWGCWTDRPDNQGRALTGSYSASTQRTIEGCLRTCAKDKSFKYAGLENGNECRCGTGLEPFSKATATCNKKCTANNGGTCGGDYALSVYKISN